LLIVDHSDFDRIQGHELGCAMKNLEKYSEALALFKKIHSGRKHLLGEDDPDTIDTNYEMGEIHFLAKRYPEAVKIFTDVHKARKRVLGKAEPETLAT